MRLSIVLTVFAALLPAVAPAQEKGDKVCTEFFGCHKKHGEEKKPCPQCGAAIPAEDALCTVCATKAKVCRHCGLPRASGGGAAGGAAKGGTVGGAPAASTPGTPRPVDQEVRLAIEGRSFGAIGAYLCEKQFDLTRGAAPAQWPAAGPLFLAIDRSSSADLETLVGALQKRMTGDPRVAIEVRERDPEAYGVLAARIKKKDPRILVGGPGTCAIHDRGALSRFAAAARPVDFLSGGYPGASGIAHPDYQAEPMRMYGVAKASFDVFFDISGEIGGKIGFPPGCRLGLNGYGYAGGTVGPSPEDRAFAATAVTNFAVVHVERLKAASGMPFVLAPVDPALAEAVKAGNEVLWPPAFPNHGGPYDGFVPLTGIATRDPETKTVHLILINNSKKNVKAATTVGGKGAMDVYFGPYEVKVLRL